MAMTAGTVAIASDGTATPTAGSMAEAIYDAFVDNYETDTGYQMPGGADSVAIKQNFATLATRLASALVTYITANAVVTTTVSAGGLQNTPDPNDPNVPTAAPAAPVNLSGTVA